MTSFLRSFRAFFLSSFLAFYGGLALWADSTQPMAIPVSTSAGLPAAMPAQPMPVDKAPVITPVTASSQAPVAAPVAVSAPAPVSPEPSVPAPHAVIAPLPKRPPTLPADASVTIMVKPAALAPAVSPAAGQDTVSVDFPNESVRTIIRNVADLYDLNVVIPESLVGNASIKLHNVTWQQIFQVLLEPMGFTYTTEHNIVRIRGKAEADQEPMETSVFVINYANLKDMKAALTTFVDAKAGGRLQTDDRSNAVIITEKPAQIRQIEKIIAQLDQPTPQVMIQSKFVEVTDNDTKNLGINWQSMSGYTLTASGGLNGGTTGDATGNIGVPAGNISRIFGQTSTYAVNAAGVKSYEGTNFSRADSAVLSAGQFSVILSALNSLNGTKLVSNPTIVTLNNVEANVVVSQQYPIPQYTYNDQTGTFEVSGFDFKDIGITMKVLPQVNKAGFITLNVKPELSSQTGTNVAFGGTTSGANSVNLPIIDSRRTESIVTIKDGYTLAIGGLVQNQKGDIINKVPILGDLPLIGLAFRSTTKTLTKRNLIIFITAKTLDPSGATYEDVFDQRILHEMRVTPADVPGYKVPEPEATEMKAIQATRERIARAEVDARLGQERLALESKEKSMASGNPGGPWQLIPPPEFREPGEM